MCESQASKDWRESIHKVIAEPTPTPSITVGTQVRLTGVVRQVQPNGVLGVDVYVGCQDGLHWFKPSEVEVIRQPFKRGEVVYHVGDEDSGRRTVLEDESDGQILLARHVEGSEVMWWEAKDFERRPSRPKEG